MAKITRKQLKEDALLSTTAKLSVFLSKYWGHIVGVIVVVSVLIAAIVLYGDYVARRNEKTARQILSFNPRICSIPCFVPDGKKYDRYVAINGDARFLLCPRAGL